MKWMLRVLVAALVVVLLSPPGSRADSIVFVKKGNVARVDPDRPRVRVMRRGGSTPFVAVSQADDGSMVAQRGRSFLRLSASGRLLSAPIDADPQKLAPDSFGPFDPEISPNGRYIVWWNGFNFVVSLPTLTDSLRSLTGLLTYFTGPVIGEIFFPTQVATNAAQPRNVESSTYGPWASWYGNRGLVSGSLRTAAVDYDPIDGKDEPIGWFRADEGSNFVLPRVSRRLDRLAVAENSNFTAEGTTSRDRISVYVLNGKPPALPVAGCFIDARNGPFFELSWAPDGKRLAWADKRGIWVAGAPRRVRGFDSECRLSSRPRLLVRGGSEPHWGPADQPSRPRDLRMRS